MPELSRHALAGAFVALVALLGPVKGARAEALAPERLSFEEAIRRAIRRNPTAVTAVEEIRRAEALAEQARAGSLPTLTGNAVYTRLDAERRIQDRVIQGVDSVNANLQLVVPIVAAQRWLEYAHAKDLVDVTKMTAEDTRRQVAIATGRAYLTVIAQQRVLETAERARDTARAHEQFARARLAGGVGNRLDAVRAGQERASNEAQVEQQRVALAKAQEALGVLVGDDVAVDSTGEATLAAPPTLAAALGEADKRSDITAQRGRVELARKVARDTYAEYLPLLSAVAQPFYQNPPTLTQPITGWQAQLVFALPIYDGGLRYGRRHERDALYDQTKTKLDGTLQQARADVRLAFESMRRTDDALIAAREASKLADEALDLAQQAYRAGATSNLEVIDAERRARDAETAAAVAEDAARQARLDLLAACGRFP